MSERIIPRDEWSEFLEAFGRQHRAWLATVERTGRRESRLLQNQPLVRIESETVRGDVEAIRIGFGDPSHEETLRVQHPRAMRLLQTSAGADRGLEIKDDEGSTRIVFRVGAFPDEIDGIAPAEEDGDG